ncbi:MAG: hypothetical protein GX023_03795 [Tissierellia bacterium]|nr:hypothetical protein [Tissierellia bacterium]
MVLAKIDLWEMCEGLKYNFLYNKDINSIHILLNLYDLEANIKNICPKYISANEIRKRVIRKLAHRKDRQLISNNIALLLHEDVARLELIIYLEGYKYGYYNNKWVNRLEDETIKHYSIDYIYDKNFLFHHSISFKEIIKFKEDFFIEIDNHEKETAYLHDLINVYCDKIIKGKIYNLNYYIDKQLKIEYDSDKLNIREEGSLLSMKELSSIYNTIVNIIIKSNIKLFKDASWYGINDRVLNRYK